MDNYHFLYNNPAHAGVCMGKSLGEIEDYLRVKKEKIRGE